MLWKKREKKSVTLANDAVLEFTIIPGPQKGLMQYCTSAVSRSFFSLESALLCKSMACVVTLFHSTNDGHHASRISGITTS